MKLIVGGAYQGKREYAETHYSKCAVLDQFHMLVWQQIAQGIDPVAHFKANCASYQDVVILCDDISCGIVPLDAQQRLWREELGRVLALVAKNSDEVIRVFCGIGTKIK